MTNLLFEISSYDIPYDLQIKTENDIKSLLSIALKQLNIKFAPIISFSTNRRLVFYIPEIDTTINPVVKVKKGPNTNANSNIINNFLNANNITLNQCYKQITPKGEYYFFNIISEPSLLKDKIATIIINDVLSKVSFKRSMFWNETKVRWARPITNFILMLGEEVINFNFAEVNSSNKINGHMFLSNNSVELLNAKDYFQAITDLHVILAASNQNLEEISFNIKKVPQLKVLNISREQIIIDEVNKFAQDNNIIPNLQPKLLTELLYLTEFPVVLFGKIPSKYLVLPKELLVDTMVKNQRYINFFNKEDNSISEHFALVANIKALDGGKEIIKGNQRVLNARLEDGLFFYNIDIKENWLNYLEKLKTINFFEELGSLFDKQERLKKLALKIFPNTDLEKICNFCKVDLASKVVTEFPELQGIMGYYYAKQANFSNEEALAIKEHYMPISSNGELPTSLLGAQLAIVDKLDTLISFFSIGKFPTSSSDPFALRRAALGIIRICLNHGISLNLSNIIDNNLLDFFIERFITYFSSLGIKKEIVLAVLSKDNFNITTIGNKAIALDKCLKANNDVIILFKRVCNIVNSQNANYTNILPEMFIANEEKSLFKNLKLLEEKYQKLFDSTYVNSLNSISVEIYNNYIKDLILLKPYIDAFLDNVHIVNPKEPIITENRLALLKLSLTSLEKIGNLELINVI